MREKLIKVMCAVVLMTCYVCSAEENTFEYQKGSFTYKSIDVADKEEFESLREIHNNQPDSVSRVPNIGNVFDNQIARRNIANAWHALTVRNTETGELVAALVFGRIAVVYEKDKFPEIERFMGYLEVTDAFNIQKEKSGLATYVLMTDMDRNMANLAEFHQQAVEHSLALACAGSALPQLGETPKYLVLLVRPDAPDAVAMKTVGYKLYGEEVSAPVNLAEFYPPKETYAYYLSLRS